jgi:hypothetical protein
MSKARRKRTVLWLILAALASGAGFFYLDGQGVDWRKQAASVNEWVSAPPPAFKGVEKPALPPEPKALPPSFDIATVDAAGKLLAAGRGEAGWTIRLQSGNATLGEVKADENNEWVVTLEKPLPPGENKLSLLEVDPSGKQSLSSKREITFTVLPREASATPERSRGAETKAPSGASSFMALSEAPKSEAQQDKCALTVVKKGDSLWEIARRCYGDGSKYTRIHETNRPMIRDPNLIFPDQKFAVPH